MCNYKKCIICVNIYLYIDYIKTCLINMLNVKFSCEIKKDIFGKPEQSASDYIQGMEARRRRWQCWVCVVGGSTPLAQNEVFEELIDRNSKSLEA